jgi:hypothetical protein
LHVTPFAGPRAVAAVSGSAYPKLGGWAQNCAWVNAWAGFAVHIGTVATCSSLHALHGPLLGFFLISLSACSGQHEAADAGVCVNEPGCTCGDGAMGRKVCDLDTHSFVMCLCELVSASTERDAGATPAMREPEAGRGAAAQPPPSSAAGSGGAAPSDARGQNDHGNGRRGR